MQYIDSIKEVEVVVLLLGDTYSHLNCKCIIDLVDKLKIKTGMEFVLRIILYLY